MPDTTERPPEWVALQDQVLIAVADGRPVTRAMLVNLPPMRAVLLARVAAKSGLMPVNAVKGLVDEAARVGGAGRLPGADR